ncbi:hypothetical protein GCM10010409_46420 [Mycolicibacterium diernhoferi]
MPVKTPVMFTWGANHTVNNRAGVPYRLSRATGAIPCVSTDRSPAPDGDRPLKDGDVNAWFAGFGFDG